MSVAFDGPPALYVRWTCRRCGAVGLARSTIPVTPDWNESMMRRLFEALKQKLVIIHLRRQFTCVPCFEDFDLSRGCPEDATVVGLI